MTNTYNIKNNDKDRKIDRILNMFVRAFGFSICKYRGHNWGTSCLVEPKVTPTPIPRVKPWFKVKPNPGFVRSKFHALVGKRRPQKLA